MRIWAWRKQYQDLPDADLVLSSLGGDREAFTEIVGRYQSLLCSLAYSSVGDLKQSEDIAQEAFVEAWRKLDSLSDPQKLKAWLCGILRFKVSRFRRGEINSPLNEGQELDEVHHQIEDTQQQSLEQQAIDQQEQTLMWQTLEQLPENYRLPLILFYREQGSVQSVAQELDITEDSVKQRLSRGRKLLQAAMVELVEERLQKSKPGHAFTLAVMVAISGIAAPKTKAAVLGLGMANASSTKMAAAKSGAAASAASLLQWLTPLTGVLSALLSLKANLALSQSQSERRFNIVVVALFLVVALLYCLAMLALKQISQSFPAYGSSCALASQLIVLGFVASYVYGFIYLLKRQKSVVHSRSNTGAQSAQEYISPIRILGIPLLHFKFGLPQPGSAPAVAWIAGGDRAYGLVFAWGGFACAPISVGIITIGGISVGAVSVGLASCGVVAFGFVAFGVSAIGFLAYGAYSALAWWGAFSGGFAIAGEAAVGPSAFAPAINNELAYQAINFASLEQNHLWVLLLMAVAVSLPALVYSKLIAKSVKLKT